jgi:hypothetical protein
MAGIATAHAATADMGKAPATIPVAKKILRVKLRDPE